MIGVLILGSKEYPFGTNRGDDPLPSGGMETYVDDLVPELSKLCRIYIITRSFRGTRKKEVVGRNITVIRVPWERGRWLRNPSFNICSFAMSFRVAKNADIIYSNGIISGFFGMVLGKTLRKKSIFRPAGVGFAQYHFPLKQMLYALEKLVFRKSDAVVFHSDGEKSNAERLFGIKIRRGHVILTGFPVKKFSEGDATMRKRLGIRKETVITAVSRFVPVKGLEYLVEACAMLDFDFRLLMVGSGPEEAKLRSLCRKKGIGDRATFTGFRRDIPDILAATDIFVVSSLFEGLPTSLLEAMASGKPCVVTDIGLPVADNETGIIVPHTDSRAISDALKLLAKNRGLRERLGKNAKKFVEENCTQEIAARKHLDLFRKLVPGGGDMVSAEGSA